MEDEATLSSAVPEEDAAFDAPEDPSAAGFEAASEVWLAEDEEEEAAAELLLLLVVVVVVVFVVERQGSFGGECRLL